MTARALVTRTAMVAVKHGATRGPVARQRRALDLMARLSYPRPRGTEVHPVWLGDRRALRVDVPGVREDRAVLWLHGGAFITMSPASYVSAGVHLARACRSPVYLLDQRLAPEHPHPADVADAVAAFDALRVPTGLIGDSAGGATVLQAALALRDRGGATPTALALISPVADFTQRLSRTWTGRDYVVSQRWADSGLDHYLGSRDRVPLSPLHRDLSGLPPTRVHWVEHERLRPESEALVAVLRAAGVEATGRCLPDLFHDVHLSAQTVPEAAEALRDLGAFLRGHP